ncbi:MAG: DUF3499 domain-containing protein [Micrococcus sp.]|nr:DUF3499 domain-containing protein [Micrococcus sp.]
MRRCTKTGCQKHALATLTYNYADSTVVIGPLARRAEPHTYDLCADHARTMTGPKGWDVLRLDLPERYEPVPGPDDLLAVAHALRPAPTPDTPVARSVTPSAAEADDAAEKDRPSLGGPDGPARPPRHGLRVVRGGGQPDTVASAEEDR